ncbi:MAG: hypothetical protein HN455_04605 [Gammaproteobacteria bacterium]|jgi:hypothetical protein|nr:hypothetical protein [Gammaproteobacteria bacterium]MBT7478820.1 hypothetical protein [Gammaproteobacteria bacterium]
MKTLLPALAFPLLLSSMAVVAENTAPLNWTSTSGEMTQASYSAATSGNRALIKNSVKSYITSSGVSEEALAVAGSAALLVTEGTITFYDRQGLSMNMNDIADDHQGLSINYSVEW